MGRGGRWQVGGVNIAKDIRAFNNGEVDILVATPGRLQVPVPAMTRTNPFLYVYIFIYSFVTLFVCMVGDISCSRLVTLFVHGW